MLRKITISVLTVLVFIASGSCLGAADSLRGLVHVYQMQKDFAKAESLLLRATKSYETMYGPDDLHMAIPWTSLCYVCDQRDKVEKSGSCHAHLVSFSEKLFGPNGLNHIQDLNGEALALRKLGSADEAAKLEQRTQSILAAQSNPN